MMSRKKSWILAIVAIAAGVLIAGFWNYHWVDGFGRDIVAGQTIGDTEQLAKADAGAGFGFVFAIVAGLAATFTACNCVVFAMLPGLACAPSSGKSPWKQSIAVLSVFAAGVVAVSFVYGVLVSGMGGEQLAQYNERGMRIAQAQITFTTIGIVLMLWGLIVLGFFQKWIRRLPGKWIRIFSSTYTQAGILGTLVGLFSVGRPFPVFRHFLEYAVSIGNPLFGGVAMAIQGVGQIVVLVLLLLIVVWLFGRPLARLSQSHPTLLGGLSGSALLAGGAFFVFYWGLAFAFNIGRWGFKLNWYG